MRSILTKIALIATIVLKVIPAILEALNALEKHNKELEKSAPAK